MYFSAVMCSVPVCMAVRLDLMTGLVDSLKPDDSFIPDATVISVFSVRPGSNSKCVSTAIC